MPNEVYRDVVNGILVNPDLREVLLQKKTMDYPHGPGFEGWWYLFGGGLDKGEDPMVGIKRELQEELGLVDPKVAYTHDRQYVVPDKWRGTKHAFTHRIGRDLSHLVIGEGAGIALFAVSELADTKINPYDLEDLQIFLERVGW